MSIDVVSVQEQERKEMGTQDVGSVVNKSSGRRSLDLPSCCLSGATLQATLMVVCGGLWPTSHFCLSYFEISGVESFRWPSPGATHTYRLFSRGATRPPDANGVKTDVARARLSGYVMRQKSFVGTPSA